MPPPAAPGTISEAKLVDKAKKWQQLQTKRYSINFSKKLVLEIEIYNVLFTF